jgi:hypothetical protein
LKFSAHAKEKIEVYGLSLGVVSEALSKPLERFYDVTYSSEVCIISLEGKLLVVVMEGEEVITLYPTSREKVEKRRRTGRWISKA